MNIDKLVQKNYNSNLLRFNICQNCITDFKTIAQLSSEMNLLKTKLRTSLNYLEQENYLVKKLQYNQSLYKWFNCYQATSKLFKEPNLIKMQEDYIARKSFNNKNTVAGPYDALILANPNLRIIRMEDIKYQRADGVRKEKWRGIGSSFSMFDSA